MTPPSTMGELDREVDRLGGARIEATATRGEWCARIRDTAGALLGACVGAASWSDAVGGALEDAAIRATRVP